MAARATVLGRRLNREVELIEPPVEVSKRVGRKLDPGGKRRLLRLDCRLYRATLATHAVTRQRRAGHPAATGHGAVGETFRSEGPGEAMSV